MFLIVTLCTAKMILGLLRIFIIFVFCCLFLFSKGQLGIDTGETKGVPTAREDQWESRGQIVGELAETTY
jgi:hypothetical protein